MSKPDFEKCIRMANELLAVQNLFCQMLDIQKLNYNKQIVFDSIQSYATYTKTPMDFFKSDRTGKIVDGFTISIDGMFIVLYNDKIDHTGHLNWTLAHEIGHIYLGHKKGTGSEEVEAHFFAAQLLMPAYSIFKANQRYGSIKCKDLVGIFGVSMESAYKRIKTLNKFFYLSNTDLDVEIWERQEEKIDLYFRCESRGRDFREELNIEIKREMDFARFISNSYMLNYSY